MIGSYSFQKLGRFAAIIYFLQACQIHGIINKRNETAKEAVIELNEPVDKRKIRITVHIANDDSEDVWRSKVYNISCEVGIRYGSTQSIITKKLGFRKMSAQSFKFRKKVGTFAET